MSIGAHFPVVCNSQLMTITGLSYAFRALNAFSALTLLIGQEGKEGSRKGIRPVKKTECRGIGMVICLERGANDLHMVQLMPLPPHHLLLE